jgi:Domain of unknown function (DUF4352)
MTQHNPPQRPQDPQGGWTPQQQGQPYGQPYQQTQPQWGQPGYTQQHAAPKRKRRWPVVAGVIAAVIVVFAILGSLGGDPGPSQPTVAASDPAAAEESSSTPAEKASKPAPKPKPTVRPAGVGDKVTDGGYEFTVTDVKDGPKRIGSEDFGHSPQGRFIYVYVTVTNNGDEPGMFHDSQVTGVDDKGRKLNADGEATIYLGEESGAFLNEINPGNTVKGLVVFDVPKASDLVSVELHESSISRGVVVAVK